MHLKVILGKCVHLEHPFAYKVSLQSMHAERLGLTNGETFIARIHIMKMLVFDIAVAEGDAGVEDN